jgi:hypothetical protein
MSTHHIASRRLQAGEAPGRQHCCSHRRNRSAPGWSARGARIAPPFSEAPQRSVYSNTVAIRLLLAANTSLQDIATHPYRISLRASRPRSKPTMARSSTKGLTRQRRLRRKQLRGPLRRLRRLGSKYFLSSDGLDSSNGICPLTLGTLLVLLLVVRSACGY